MNTCVVCSTQFEAKRKDAKFCSDACRKKLKRTNVTDNVRDNRKDVRDNVTLSELNLPADWDGVECKFGPCLNRSCRFRP